MSSGRLELWGPNYGPTARTCCGDSCGATITGCARQRTVYIQPVSSVVLRVITGIQALEYDGCPWTPKTEAKEKLPAGELASAD